MEQAIVALLGWLGITGTALAGAVLWVAPRVRKLIEDERVRSAVLTGLRWSEEQARKRQSVGQPVSGEVKLEGAVAKARELGPRSLLSKSDAELQAYVEAQLAVERQSLSRPPPISTPSLPPAKSLLEPLPPEVVAALRAPGVPRDGLSP